MYYSSPDDNEKFKLLDLIFLSLTIDELKSMFGEDLVAAKLKDVKMYHQPIAGIPENITDLRNETVALKAEISMLRSDIGTLLRCLNRGMGDQTTSYDFNTLKHRYGVY